MTSTTANPTTTSRKRFRMTRIASLAITVAATVTGGLAFSGPAQAAGFQRGPAPTVASISATTGPLAVKTKTVASNGKFGGLTVYYPATATAGTYGVVAIVPGFVSLWSQMAWMGPRLASQGFVVIGVDTSTLFDLPSFRAEQFKAAIEAEKTDTALTGIADFNRVAISGWSMGGGGALDAATTGDYKAVIPLAPWEVANPGAKVSEPTLMVAGQGDTVAPASSMSTPFYNSVTSPKKAYLEIANGSHFFPTSANTPLAAAMISWLKIYVDGDTRYSKFVCPTLAVSSGVSSYKAVC